MKLYSLAAIAVTSSVCATLLNPEAADPPTQENRPPCCYEADGAHFYLKFGSGYSFSRKGNVRAPFPFWDRAVQGYNDDYGQAPIISGGFGYEFCPLLSADIMASYRPNYTYDKKQNGLFVPGTIGFAGNKTRRFKLDVSSIMGSLYLSGHGISWLNWRMGCSSSLYPFIGGGVGMSQLTIHDFRSTGEVPIAPNPAPSFSEENQYSVRYRFTYQGMAGFEYRYRDCWALAIGYRWIDAGRFSGPQYLRDADGAADDAQGNEWRMRFSANEAYAELKVLF